MLKNKLHWLFIISFLTLSVLSCSGSAMAAGVTGTQQADYRFIPRASVATYENAGYRMNESPEGIIHVTVDVTPLRNNTPYPTPITNTGARMVLDSRHVASLPANIRKMAHTLVKPCRGYFQAVSAILNWVTGHFHYQLQTRNPLQGDCSAAAKLTVQILAEVGIPARTVIGVVVEKDRSLLSGKALHSFVEIYYPGTGWLFSDPLSSHHFVPASYVLLNHSSTPDYFGLTLRSIRQPISLESVATNDRSGIPGRINLFRFN